MLLGEVDLVLVVELPDNEHAIQTSAALTKLLGIAFTTSPAMGLEQFDKFIGRAGGIFWEISLDQHG